MAKALRTARTFAVLAALAFAFTLARGRGTREPLALPAPPPLPGADGRAGVAAAPALEGFVVWESNRSGRWRLYRKQLDGSGLRRLTPDQDPLDHCCAHISPDGTRLAYLRYRPGQRRTSDRPPRAVLHLMAADGRGDRTLAEPVRLPSEMRSVTWLDDRRLLYVDAGGHTQQLDLGNGARTPMTRDPHPEDGWLMNATLEHATAGWVTFSPYDRGTRTIAERRDLGGCQPYFSHDGRYGFWIAGAGGPINRIQLATREVGTVLRKHDPVLPADRGYLYFPMLSRDGGLLAFGASPDEHDFRTADYDLFVVETDPRTLDPVAAPVRLTSHPATDRFPDVFQPPLPLGRHVGEIPLALDFVPASAAAAVLPASDRGWTWDYGDGSTELTGAVARHTYAEPGHFEVVARREDIELRGRVRALAERRASEPPAATAGAASRWPSDRRSLVLLWERGNAPNLVTDPELGADRTYGLAPRGQARLDRAFRMQLDAGAFVAGDVAAERVAQALHATNELTLELVFEAASLETEAPGDLVSFAAGSPRRLNFRLTQEAGRLSFALRGGDSRLLRLASRGPHHLVATYSPGQLRAYLDGEALAGVEPLTGDFFHFGRRPLVFGSGPWGGRDWRGWLEGIALYNRVLEPSEVEANAERYRHLLRARTEVEERRVMASLRRRSPTPTLEQIEPYREALVVYEYDAAGARLFVAHWALLDGQPTPPTGWGVGERRELRLEPFSANPQLEGQIVEDRVSAAGSELWFDIGPW